MYVTVVKCKTSNIYDFKSDVKKIAVVEKIYEVNRSSDAKTVKTSLLDLDIKHKHFVTQLKYFHMKIH